MHCPKCGEIINDFQHFCSNCGTNLDDKAELFRQHKKNVKSDFINHCKNMVNETGGVTKIACTAWFITTNTNANYAYLQGDKMGDPKSYDLLDFAVESAEELFLVLFRIQKAYQEAEPIGFLNGGVSGIVINEQ